MFDFHESLMPTVGPFFSGLSADVTLFMSKLTYAIFPRIRGPPLSWFNSIELNARYAAEDAIKKSRRKLKVGGWSKFNLNLPVKALRFKLKGLYATSRMIQRSCLLYNNHARKYILVLR